MARRPAAAQFHQPFVQAWARWEESNEEDDCSLVIEVPEPLSAVDAEEFECRPSSDSHAYTRFGLLSTQGSVTPGLVQMSEGGGAARARH